MPTSYNNNLNLFLQGGEVPSASGIVSLVTFGISSNSGMIGSLDLYLQSVVASGTVGSGLNLMLLGPTQIQTTSNINLFIEGTYNSTFSYLPLYVQNNYAATGIQLYISGKSSFGEADLGINRNGFVPIGSGLNLYIKRVDENAVLDLFLKTAEGVVSGVLDLYLNSASGNNNSLNLSIPNTYSVASGIVNLFTSGF